jgi:hypothetical protein
MPSQCPKAFSIYLHWTYCGTIDLWDGEEDKDTLDRKAAGGRPGVGPRYDNLVSSYILGEFIKDNHFCNALVDSYFDLLTETKTLFDAKNVNRIFEGLPAASKLRLLVTHGLAFDTKPAEMVPTLQFYSPEVWRALAETLVTQDYTTPTQCKRPQARRKCFYHVHEGQSRCM